MKILMGMVKVIEEVSVTQTVTDQGQVQPATQVLEVVLMEELAEEVLLVALLVELVMIQ